MNRTELFWALPPAIRRRASTARNYWSRPPRRNGGSWCLAPSMQMHLLPDGDVRACCRNSIPLGNIAEQRLPAIWASTRRAIMTRELDAGKTPTGCENCAMEVAVEGRRGSFPEVFDFWENRLGRDGASTPWPTRMEFNLSNHCNLQCVQCSGDLSSSIRIHREGRAALPTVYDDLFFDDLRTFVPHLRHANFAGGEPFLGAENFRVWEIIAELSPGLDCTINTNATQWNRRVQDVLDRGRFSFIFSLDGISKQTFESIRVGADLGVVLANVERFREYSARSGTDVNINHCLMPQNHHEFGDLLLYAEERQIQVNCSVVRTPEECSIAHLPQSEIRAIHRRLKRQERALLPQLRLNAGTWIAEVRRIETWAEHGPPSGDDTTPEPQPVRVRTKMESKPEPEPTILGLPRRGDGPTHDWEARRELRNFSSDDVVHSVTVGDGELVTECSPGLLDLLEVGSAQLEGRPVSYLGELAARRFGVPQSESVQHHGPDRIDIHSMFETVEGRASMLALRDRNGWARQARILIALRTR